MSASWEAVTVGVALLATMAGYAIFAGADFGGGIWDLLAGGARRGERPRAAIDASMTPVWEGNQVWIVLGLVLLWTGFPTAFAALTTALFVPLAASVLGILARGVGFSFRHEAQRLPMRRLSGALFAASSLIAPFFLGASVGAVATGGVTPHPAGNVLSAWTSPTALATGGLFVSACAFVGAVYLVGDCHRRGQDDLVRYFSRRAIASGVATGALSGVNLALIRTSAPYVFGRLVGVAAPLVALSVLAGAASVVLLLLHRTTLVRVLAALAVVAVVAAWGLAQYPWLLPRTLDVSAGSAPRSALLAEIAVIGMALVLVAPAFALLYWLQQHGVLRDTSASTQLRAAAAEQQQPSGQAARPTSRQHRSLTALVLAVTLMDLLRRGRRPRATTGTRRPGHLSQAATKERRP